jgi:hypothetical protein
VQQLQQPTVSNNSNHNNLNNHNHTVSTFMNDPTHQSAGHHCVEGDVMPGQEEHQAAELNAEAGKRQCHALRDTGVGSRIRCRKKCNDVGAVWVRCGCGDVVPVGGGSAVWVRDWAERPGVRVGGHRV